MNHVTICVYYNIINKLGSCDDMYTLNNYHYDHTHYNNDSFTYAPSNPILNVITNTII